MQKRHAIWGVAGSGKTTFLADILLGKRNLLDLQFTPENTLCISFSRMAKYVLAHRLNYTFTVNTFHSFISQELKKRGMLRIVDNKTLSSFFIGKGYEALKEKDYRSEDYVMEGHIYDDLNKYCLLDISPEEYYYSESIEKSRDFYDLTLSEWIKLVNDFNEFIKQNGSDYTDILVKGTQLKLYVKNVVVDEAQDLSPLMNKILNNWDIENIILVGDPNQNVFEFAGSTPDILLSADKIYELVKSNRVPDKIFNYASEYIVYPFSSGIHGNGQNGTIIYDEPDFTWLSSQSSYILTYTRKRAIEEYSKQFRKNNIPHLLFNSPVISILVIRLYYLIHAPENLSLYDLKQLILESRLKNKTKIAEKIPSNEYSKKVRAVDHQKELVEFLNKTGLKAFHITPVIEEQYHMITKNERWLNPTLNVSTIHQVKGGEADVVYVDADFNYRLDWHYISRLKYVACTRAKKILYVKED